VVWVTALEGVGTATGEADFLEAADFFAFEAVLTVFFTTIRKEIRNKKE
jgi:hypothetical protein